MSTYIHVESNGAQVLRAPSIARLDPTGTPPDFQVTAVTETDASGTWAAGTWEGTWDSVTGEVVGLTPLAGDGAALDIAQGSFQKLWVRWVHGGETVVSLAAYVFGV